MSIIADLAVPGGPTITMCSPAIADTVIRRMISCLSRNCAPIWRASSWNAAEARATSTAKLRGVVGGATICCLTLPQEARLRARRTGRKSSVRLPQRLRIPRLALHRIDPAHPVLVESHDVIVVRVEWTGRAYHAREHADD